MNKEETFQLLEKNLFDWRQSKLDKKPIMSNFHFYCMCYMPLVDRINKMEDLTQEDRNRLAKCEKDYEEIKELPYVDIDDYFGNKGDD